MSLPTPYYEADGITIYHADCRDVLPHLSDVDAVVTDPPYGIRADQRQAQRANKRHGKAAAPSRDYGASDWDHTPPDAETLASILDTGEYHIMWGGNYFALPPASGWLVWDKETGNNGYADCELAWTDIPMAARLYRFRWMGMLQRVPEQRYHPTQKPVPVMRWAQGFLPTSCRVVLDPFMGSGSTLRAAADLGRRAIGVEIVEEYCEIAVKRLAQQVIDFGGAA